MKPVKLLAIDTSCDDTSAAVVENGRKMLSNVVSGQSEIHEKYGGIVPELASRRHVEIIWPTVDEALKKSNTSLNEIDAICVCYGPGLIGSLLVGTSFAKSLAYAADKPLIAVNHLEGHMFSPFLLADPENGQTPTLPFICLLVSGGHTSMYVVHEYGKYEELGRTRDDALGEAYDKVAKMLGLGYPGGPHIDRLAKKGDPKSINFPRPYLHGSFDFSFSGLKTAVRNFIKSQQKINSMEDICASFQKSAIDVILRKISNAIKTTGVHSISLVGGVAANSALRQQMDAQQKDENYTLFLPPLNLCTDNAAMIGACGYEHYKRGFFSSMALNPQAYLPL